ncbi:MAG: hypothetical protein ACR2P7_00955 [bacterium]
MTKPTVFKRADIQHRFDDLPENGTYIKPFITTRNCESMAGGINFLHKTSILGNSPATKLFTATKASFGWSATGNPMFSIRAT